MTQLPAWLVERGCVYEPDRKPDHEDDRRALWTAFNGEFNFTAQQAKLAAMKGDRVLGGHYHHYNEFFMIWMGRVVFRLVDPETSKRFDVLLQHGGRLLIPTGVAHAAIVSSGALLLGFTPEPYISPDHNDIRFEIEPPSLSPVSAEQD